MTDKEIEAAEAKLIPILQNEPSDPVEVLGGVRLIFKRPTLPMKYRYQIWLGKRLKDVGLDETDTENEFFYYWNYFGLLNAYVVALILPDVTRYEYDQKEDLEYKFLFENYVGEQLYHKGIEESSFIVDAIEKFNTWQAETSIAPEELKNS